METLRIEQIRTNGGTQPRSEVSQFVVDDYAAALATGAEFPPVVVFHDGADYWLADGFHRRAAYAQAGREEIPVVVRQGTRRDAVLYSVGANAAHGLPRSNEDKRRSVRTLLFDEEWARWSDREIAGRCAVSHVFVGKVRAELSPETVTSEERRYVTKHGTESVMRIGATARIAPEARDLIRETAVVEDRRQVVALADLPADRQVDIARRISEGSASSVREAVRLARRDELSKRGMESFPDGKYRVIYADPPWKYGDERTGLGTYAATAAADHYPTMSVEDLCALDVESLADDDAVLFCWATFPLLPDALEVVHAWGFTYKTAFVWHKQRSNVSSYHSASAEVLLICTRGSCTPEIDERVDQVQAIARGRHSEKPEAFRALIDRLYPTGPRIELFRRGDAPGDWDVWGNEAEAA